MELQHVSVSRFLLTLALIWVFHHHLLLVTFSCSLIQPPQSPHSPNIQQLSANAAVTGSSAESGWLPPCLGDDALTCVSGAEASLLHLDRNLPELEEGGGPAGSGLRRDPGQVLRVPGASLTPPTLKQRAEFFIFHRCWSKTRMSERNRWRSSLRLCEEERRGAKRKV